MTREELIEAIVRKAQGKFVSYGGHKLSNQRREAINRLYATDLAVSKSSSSGKKELKQNVQQDRAAAKARVRLALYPNKRNKERASRVGADWV